ncbi:hypothetical protein [Acetobacter sp. DsW_063]|nr:hypothetical protein [Acetobacter sp. DsW_063]
MALWSHVVTVFSGRPDWQARSATPLSHCNMKAGSKAFEAAGS